MFKYKVTLTASGGLSADNIDTLVKYFTAKCSNAYLVNEFGESGSNSHLEGVIELKEKKTGNVTRGIASVYKKMDIEVLPRITIVVKSVCHLAGALQYASKELKDQGNVSLLLGWEKTWIQRKVESFVSTKAPTTLLSMGTWVSKRLAPAIIYTWCKAHNCEIRSLSDYRAVCVSMGEEGFMFDKGVHKVTVANVMALFGSGEGHGKVIDDECRFLEL